MKNIEKFFSDEIVVLDTETSNFEITEAEIIEIAFGTKSNGIWKTEAFQFKPEQPITAQAMATTWITNEDVSDKGSYSGIHEAVLGINSFIVAHNSSYDRDVIVMNHDRYDLDYPSHIANPDNWICTLKLARKLFRNDNLPEFKLSFLWFHTGLYKTTDREIHAHRADSDIYMTGRLLEFMIQKLIDIGEIDELLPIGPQLVEYQTAPYFLDSFPFGKHRGKSPYDIPNDYYEWLLSTDSFDKNSRNYDPNLELTVLTVLNERLEE